MGNVILLILLVVCVLGLLATGVYFVFRPDRKSSDITVLSAPVDGKSLVKIQKAGSRPLYRITKMDGKHVDIIPQDENGEDDDMDEAVLSNMYLLDRLVDEDVPVAERVALKRRLVALGYEIKVDFGEAEKRYADGLVESEKVDAVDDGGTADDMESPEGDDTDVRVHDNVDDDAAAEEDARGRFVDRMRLMGLVFDALKDDRIMPVFAALAEERLGLRLSDAAWEGKDREDAYKKLSFLESDPAYRASSLAELKELMHEHIEGGAAENAAKVEKKVKEELAEGRTDEGTDEGQQDGGGDAPYVSEMDPLAEMGI